MIRKDIVYLAIIVVLLVIVAVQTCQSPPPDPSEALYLDSIKELKSQKAVISSQFERLKETSEHKAKKSDSIVALQEREINRLKIKASTRRTQVQVVIDTIPALRAFVETQDSIILTQAVLIDTLKNQLSFERGVRENLVALHYDSDKISAQLQELSEQRIITLENDLKKEKRKGRFKAVLIPIVGVAGLLLGMSL